MTDAANPVVVKILDFLQVIGIAFALRPITGDCFMPGITLENGIITIDLAQLKYPGDILHEAGHIATLLPEERQNSNGKLPDDFSHLAWEMMAQAWSYAACVNLNLDPHVVFHEDGYNRNSGRLIESFSSAMPVALPTLQWLGMAYDRQNAEKMNTLAYPNMINWVRQA